MKGLHVGDVASMVTGIKNAHGQHQLGTGNREAQRSLRVNNGTGNFNTTK